jgi:hypothetical protein
MRSYLYLLMAVMALGCSDSTAPDPAAGTYTLLSLDGETLPFDSAFDEDTVTTEAGDMELTGDRHFAIRLFTRWRLGNGETEVDTIRYEGRYTHDGTSMTFTQTDADPYPATIVGDILTINAGEVWVFEKEE